VIVLGFDTATHATAVALTLADGRVLHARDDPAPDAHPGHATRLLAMAAGLLREGEIQWPELERVAVGVGPGRFTGLRVGIATARGIAQALSIELAGVSTLEALAQEAARARGAQQARILAVIDARRGELFAGAYGPATEAGRAGQPAVAALAEPPIWAPLAPEQLANLLAPDSGNGGSQARWLAVGDGALLARAHLQAAGAEVPPDGSPLHAVHGRAVCELGARAAPPARLEQLLPDYRRLADARERTEERASQEPAVLARGASAR
jgi:tRNA threonylcarbamoyladenosine biosynthesis protein TsaB